MYKLKYHSDLFFYAVCFLLIAISFYFFGSFNPAYFNSDQAIQALMIKDFHWPDDSYYWGQNRLGSLLPLVSCPIYFLFNFHPIWIVSIVNYCMLSISWVIISTYFNNNFSKLLLLLVIFFPHPTYQAIFHVAHPYPQQIFCITLSIAFNSRIINTLTNHQHFNAREYVFLFLSILSAILGCWVSELTVVYFVFIVFYALLDNDIRNALFIKGFKPTKNGFRIIIYSTVLLLLGLFWILDLKHNITPDPTYDKFFINTKEQLTNQFYYFFKQLKDVAFLRNHHSIFECLFYYNVFSMVTFNSIWLRVNTASAYKPMIKAIGYTLIFASILLFFSSWNYRSQFDPKYFTLLYVYVFVLIALSLNYYNDFLRVIIFVSLSLSILIPCIDIASNQYSSSSVFTLYGKAKEVPKGTLVANYWDAYKIAAIANTNLQGVSKDDWDRRNDKKKSSWINNREYYFLSKEISGYKKNGDTLQFLNLSFMKTNKEYIVFTDTLLLFKRLGTDINF